MLGIKPLKVPAMPHASEGLHGMTQRLTSGENLVGPKIVGPKIVGEGIVGNKIVGNKIVGPKIVGEGIVGPKRNWSQSESHPISGENLVGPTLVGQGHVGPARMGGGSYPGNAQFTSGIIEPNRGVQKPMQLSQLSSSSGRLQGGGMNRLTQ